MRKLCTILCVICLLFSAAVPAAAGSEITVKVLDESVVWTDATPFIDENNRTLVPLRPVADALGLEVKWDEKTRTASFTGTYKHEEYTLERTMTFTIGETNALVIETEIYGDSSKNDTTGYIVEMDTAAIIKGDRTYAPIRYLAEAFEYSVSWDGNTRTIYINNPKYWVIYDNISYQQDRIVLAFRAGELFENYNGMVISNVTINGKEARFKVSEDDPMLSEINSLFENGNYFLLFFIYGNFEIGNTYVISFDVYWRDENGVLGLEPETAQLEWKVEGYGGY